MSKITIVSRDDQALLIDIGGCTSFKEAIEQLSSTFLSSNQFWQDQIVDLNLGSLLLSKTQAAQIIALVTGVGAQTKHIFARSASTFSALEEMQLSVSKEQPETLLSISVVSAESELNSSSPAPNVVDLQTVNALNNQETNVLSGVKEADSDNRAKPAIGKVIVFETNEQSDSQAEIANQFLPLEPADSQEISTFESDDIKPKTKVVNNSSNETKKRNALYLRQTLRAGQAVSHKGDLIIIGDVNAGAEVMAEGDITIWGSLRGIAHAGIDGNTKAEIRALRLQPIQIRIADAIARSPDRTSTTSPNSQFAAETAKLVNGKIRILHKSFDG